MNYWIEHTIKDKRFWIRVAIQVVILSAIIEFILWQATGYAFLGGYLYKIVFFGGIFILILIAIRDTKKEKKQKQTVESQKVFETRRKYEIEAILRENPEFKTLCFECCHFDEAARTCQIEHGVQNKRALEIKIGENQIKFCLYWESLNQV